MSALAAAARGAYQRLMRRRSIASPLSLVNTSSLRVLPSADKRTVSAVPWARSRSASSSPMSRVRSPAAVLTSAASLASPSQGLTSNRLCQITDTFRS